MSERFSPEAPLSSDQRAERLGMSLDDYLHAQEYGTETQYLAHQAAAQTDIIHALKSRQHEGFVELPTSSGKTFLMTNIAAAADRAGLRTLLLAPTVNIAEQIVGQDKTRGLGKFTDLLDENRVGRQYGGSKADQRDPVVVSTYSSLNTFAQTGELGKFDVILADEAHRSLGPVTSNTLRTFHPDAVKLGFTATPYYGIGKSVDEVYGEAIHRLSLREAIESGITAPVQSLIYKTDAEIPLLDPQLTGFSTRELHKLLTLKGRNNAVIEFTKNFVANGMRGIVSCVPGSNLAHAKFMARAISEQTIDLPDGTARPIQARSIGAHQTNIENARILEQYETGEIDVLTFVRGLELGWDSRQPSFLVNASPTTSPVRMTQLMGRILRPKADGSPSVVVDFVDNSQKQQVTSLQVLGEEAIDFRRLVGSGSDHNRLPHALNIQQILHSGLYDRIAASQGRIVSDLYIGERASDSLQARYDRQLAREGMPAELPSLVTVPEFALRALEQARQAAFDQTGDERPTMESIQQEILAIRPRLAEERALGLAHAVFASMAIENADHYDQTTHPDLVHEMFVQRQLSGDLNQALSTLTANERLVLERRYLQGKTLGEIGKELTLTIERIRQISNKAIKKLRHPSRAQALAIHAEDRPWMPLPESETDTPNERAKKAGIKRAKQFIFTALRDLPSSLPYHAQRYTHGHQRVLNRKLQEHRSKKDLYLLSASHSKAALAHYQREASLANDLAEQINNLRSGNLPEYTVQQVIEIELANTQVAIQAITNELVRSQPESDTANELTKRQTDLIAYHKELTLAQHAKNDLYWDNKTGDWASKYGKRPATGTHEQTATDSPENT